MCCVVRCVFFFSFFFPPLTLTLTHTPTLPPPPPRLSTKLSQLDVDELLDRDDRYWSLLPCSLLLQGSCPYSSLSFPLHRTDSTELFMGIFNVLCMHASIHLKVSVVW